MTQNEIGIRSFVERQNATFRHERVERIVWQPRFSDWYAQNHIHNLRRDMTPEQIKTLAFRCPDLPKEVYGMELDEIYDYLHASPRYPGECWPTIGFFQISGNPDAQIESQWATDEMGNRHHRIKTPYGNLNESWKQGSSYPEERILKTKDDFKAVEYYLEQTCAKCTFLPHTYDLFKEINEGRCVSSASPWRSPYNKCIVELGGTKATMLLMKRYPKEFDVLCQKIEEINSKVIMPAILQSPIEYISFGDNVDGRNNPPPVYEKYLLPFFDRCAKECKRAGKYTFAHYDGDLELVLPYLNNDQYPFDGIEAPTFKPQGNVSLHDFRKALGDRIIVLDGIPSTIFLEEFTETKFVDLVNEVMHAFSPNLILGVSDEYSPNGLFKRMQMVAQLVEKFRM